MLSVYVYKNCDACRRALRWLDAQGLAYEARAIRETPPSPAELAAMLRHLDGARRRLCNTSGADYRASGLGAELESLPEATFLARLAANGNLVKRPFLLRSASANRPALGLVGFAEDAWSAALRF
jgi:arsenate reductase (glutaredoxin)